MTVLRWLAALSAAGLLLAWCLYPAFIALLARLRRRPRPAETSQPAVSVVIATREAAEAIEARVRNLLETNWPADRLEIVIAHDRRVPPPDLAHLSTGGARIVVTPGDEAGGKAAGLNAGVRAATGSVLVFTDTYQRFAPDTIPNLVRAVLQPGVGAASGALQLRAGTGRLVSTYWAFERWLRREEAKVHSTVGVTGAVYALRRSLWTELPTGLILDDVHVPMRVVLDGHRIDFVESAPAFETRTPTADQEYGRKVRTLTGVVQLCAWLPRVLNPFANPIWLQFVCHKLLRLLTPYAVLLLSVWLIAETWVFAGPLPVLLSFALVGAFAALIARLESAWARGVRRLAREGVLLQVAVLMAGFNGMRGHWRVWDA